MDIISVACVMGGERRHCEFRLNTLAYIEQECAEETRVLLMGGTFLRVAEDYKALHDRICTMTQSIIAVTATTGNLGRRAMVNANAITHVIEETSGSRIGLIGGDSVLVTDEYHVTSRKWESARAIAA